MADRIQISYSSAIEIISKQKQWPAGAEIEWQSQAAKCLVNRHAFRIGLSTDGGITLAEGLFVQCFYRPESEQGIRDKFSVALIAENQRIFAVDDNGLRMHLNKYGKGKKYYRQHVGLPHVHRPVEDSIDRYVEPIQYSSIEDLWSYFLAETNINGAPNISLPSGDQLLLI